jgi:predicted nuclease with TOPRIM domain
MAQHDRRDDRIAELKKGLEALREENGRLKDKLAQTSSLDGEVGKLKEQLSERDKTIAGLKKEIEQVRSFLRTTDRKTAQGLDPAGAAQLSENVKVPLVDGRPAFAQDGDVVACGEGEDINAIRKRLGTSFSVHHVTKATFDELAARQKIRV